METFAALLKTEFPRTLELAQALGAPLVALVVAVVASFIQYNQWRTARDKLRFDLFAQRIEIYNSLFFYFHEKTNQADISQEEFRAIEKCMNLARFLFPSDAFQYLARLKTLFDSHRDYFILWNVQEQKDFPDTNEQARLAVQMRERHDQLMEEWTRAPSVLQRYLYLGNVR